MCEPLESRIKYQYNIHGASVFFANFWLARGGIYKQFYENFNLSPAILGDIAVKFGKYAEYKEHREHLRKKEDKSHWSKFVAVETRNIYVATKMGRHQIVMDLLKEQPQCMNVPDYYDNTILYYAAFCGHVDLVKMLGAEGAVCDWDRTIINSPNLDIRSLVKTLRKQYERREEAVLTIQRGMHNWLWEPTTKDGQLGINARLLLKQMQKDGLCSEDTSEE